MSDSKPFEIRAEILKLAKDIISENAHMLMNSPNKPLTAPGFTAEQVIKEAEKLYAFVVKK